MWPPPSVREKVLLLLNSYDPSLQFTMEAPLQGRPIAFLDLTCYINEKQQIQFMHYRKPTQTTRAIPFHSHHPLLQKTASIKQEVKRVTSHTSDKQLLSHEFRYIIYKFLRNGYPLHYITRYTNYSWALAPPPRKVPPDNKMFLPYVATTSRIIHNAAQKADTQLIQLPSKSIGAIMLPIKPPRLSTPLDLQSHLIYGIPCLECDCIYI